jgi:hypothetical protein
MLLNLFRLITLYHLLKIIFPLVNPSSGTSFKSLIHFFFITFASSILVYMKLWLIKCTRWHKLFALFIVYVSIWWNCSWNWNAFLYSTHFIPYFASHWLREVLNALKSGQTTILFFGSVTRCHIGLWMYQNYKNIHFDKSF